MVMLAKTPYQPTQKQITLICKDLQLADSIADSY